MIQAQRRRGSTKVAHLTSVHEVNDTRIAQKECASLAAEGYDVVIVAPGEPRELPDGVRHHAVPAPRNRFERLTATMWHVFRAARSERCDVYHFHDPELIAVGVALRLLGARVIFDVHEDVPADVKTKPWIPRAFRPAISFIASICLRCVQGLFTAIVPATPSIARSFTHRRTIVVRNYPRSCELMAEQGAKFEDRPMEAIYLGSITLLRGVEQMVNAMADPVMPSSARLMLAGRFEVPALRDRVANLPGWSRVNAPGHLSRSESAAALARARMGLLLLLPAPNHDHAMPTKFFEYLGAGLPVIASKFLLAYREVVDKYGCAILVDPRDPSEIASAMALLFARPSEAEAMGERGRQALRGRYDWGVEARNLINLYKEIA
jgi:glycosyltransferase involved in cell wall biosynthesis